MSITSTRINPQLVEEGIVKHLGGKSGRRVVLTDQDFDATHPEVEVINVRTQSPDVTFSRNPPSHVLYAVDQDDLGLPFIAWLIEHNIKFYPVFIATPAHWIHKDVHARSAIESEFAYQQTAGFDKFDFGYGDGENICQALGITRTLGGAYVEVGCFRGSSGGVALKYMQEAGIYRPTYFLDVFHGFTYKEAKSSADAIWADSHATEGLEVVAARLKRFEKPTLGRPVNVVMSNIITDDLPSEIDVIAVANLDVDQFEAIRAGLVKLAPKIAIGGILIVEDPGHTPLLIGAVAALDTFLATEVARDFMPIYMSSGQYFLIRIRGHASSPTLEVA